MTLLQAIILGIIEGLTEFLPVSSTGHLLLAQAAMGLHGGALESYAIIIQLGAVLAVIVYYRERLLEMVRGLFSGDSSGRRLALNLLVAFIPAAMAGLLLEKFIDVLMAWVGWVALALILGGVLMIVVEKKNPRGITMKEQLQDITLRDAIFVGCIQCFALWPGMSRAMCTIVGGQLRRFSSSLASEFSFLLAIPTLGAATLYKLLKDHEAVFHMEGGLPVFFAGLIVSFLVAWAAIAWFLRVVKQLGMVPFGVYRIVIGIVTFILIWRGSLQ